MGKQALPAPLLYTRRQAAALLGGVSLPTVIRLEREGKLRAIRLLPKQHSQVFYAASEIQALVNGQKQEKE